ncbi:TetR/AcrR family transcriptional regulator [Actinorugispora endophytica]|uniref:TetR family transcriptional regulator n=1 Tax=Actinorugispora endophytica TaxID=1605990 RepID=A0A4R6UN72_9ACTN|nr:TetR family transcriptional regulator [Actinorugispora endophytica]TDQ46913.1 TetR family transcriptional regulator [Actinorugispora endophytica]
MSELGLRERKKRETRRSLRRHALRLVAERGVEGVTVEEIAAAANVSPRTFFNYFSSKEEVLFGEGPPRPDERALAAFAAGGPSGVLIEDLKICMLAPLEEYSPSLEEVRMAKRVLHGEPQLMRAFHAGFATLEQALAGAVAERTGDDPADVRPQLTAVIGVAALRFSMRRWVSGEHAHSDLGDVLAAAFDELKKGFSGT